MFPEIIPYCTWLFQYHQPLEASMVTITKLQSLAVFKKPILPRSFHSRNSQKLKIPTVMGIKITLVKQPKLSENPNNKKCLKDTSSSLIIFMETNQPKDNNNQQLESYPLRAIAENHAGKKTGHNPAPMAAQFHR